ncbi:P-loop containing nucleoside triphosphate hydrolase protein [Jimgerdemannia flammicorona]|uniref:P-loop containing nucleoside triphosphate hydrolase protein n=1 Tax=Jimgerdemannia flammicorona TaxID=994334 RepID=A0A433D707_9FUNG|nr:P-loop containing nucleoside triphosphate hydrolase protein [Jimgerdemannia flammicorona]
MPPSTPKPGPSKKDTSKKSKTQNATETSKQKRTINLNSSEKKPSHNQTSIQEPRKLTDRHFTLAERMQRIYQYPPDDSGDSNGPRHDNDEREISDINVIPTPSEITSSRPPFLPSDAPNAARHFLPKGWKRQLDIQFRLSREDMLSDLRDGLNEFIRALDKPLPNSQASLTPLRNRITDKEFAMVHQHVNVYENVKFNWLNQVAHREIGAEMSFLQPVMRTAYTYEDRREFWMNSKKRLMEQQLVCFIWRAGEEEMEPNITISRNPFNIIFGVIIHRDLHRLSVDSHLAYITVQFRPSDYIKILEGASEGNFSENFMIESPGAYFEAFKPILEALKQSPSSTMPFGRYLAPKGNIADASTNGDVQPPRYATKPEFQFDLSVVCGGKSLKLDVRDASSRTKAINGLRKFSDLDDSQAKAVVETLSREVALIQGPPGTGKTKIGIDLVQILLHNHEKAQLGPILCICVTNHALDQFLEHLLDKGVKNIVRVGSQSKTERLDEFNLSELKMKKMRPYNLRSEIRELEKEFNETVARAARIFNAWRYLSWRLLGPFLQKRCPKQFTNLDHSTCPLQFPLQNNDYRDPFIHWICGDDIKEKQAEIQEKKKGQNIRQTNRFTALSGEGNNPSSNSYRTAKKSWANSVTTDIPMTNRPLAELDLNPNVWHMSLNERNRLVESWEPIVMKSERRELQRELPGLLHKCDQLLESLQYKRSGTTLSVFRDSSIIGMTTNGAAKYRDLLLSVAPKVIICEEAGEVLESHILTALSLHTEHLIMIGDHLQLRPQVNTYRLRTDSGMKYQLDKSLFERLVTSTENAALPMSTLETQRRMRPEISELIRMTLYPNLIDGENTGAYPAVAGMMNNLFFMDHRNPQNARNAEEQSFSNDFELKMVKAFAEYIVLNGYDQPGDVAVLTPYLGQLAKLQRTLSDTFNLSIDERDKEQLDQAKAQRGERRETDEESSNNDKALQKKKRPLTLRTIDNFQGEEAKIVIISLVRNIEKNDRRGQIGFLKSENRTNVLLSRAQHGMILFGNADVMERGSPMWANIVKKLREDGRLGPKLPIVCQKHSQTKNDVDTPEKLKVVAPEGGCALMCNKKMQCGHICPSECHPYDPKHTTFHCLKPCRRYHHACGHPCPKNCCDSCGECEVIVGPITLNCGHKLATTKCWQAQNRSKLFCTVMAERKLLTCEHSLSMMCSADITTVRCTQLCKMPLPCGHKCQQNCLECQDYNLEKPTVGERIERTYHPVCTSSCGKIPSCGHPCSLTCHPQNACLPCQPCAANVALRKMETLTLGDAIVAHGNRRF